jgi:hypothetical protein
MKSYILLLILLTSISIMCTPQKEPENKTIAIINDKIQKVELKEQTRGTNRIITFEPDILSISLNDDVEKLDLSKAEWQNISKQISLINLQEISLYESPTQERFSDRALSSSIIIFSNGKTYESKTFDAGKPPTELEGLYLLLKNKVRVTKRGEPKLR